MKFPKFNHPVTGVVVPVSALKTEDSIGIGEFADLEILGRWCASAGIKLIQILPVNDTGFERSPYSALSAFALHPVYARLPDFPEAEGSDDAGSKIRQEITLLGKNLKNDGNIDFDAVVSGKMTVLRSMWETVGGKSLKEIEKWGGNNPWVRNYALFSLLKEENRLKAWGEWDSHRNPDDRDLNRLWKKRKKEALFWVWLQRRLETQFTAASESLDALGVALKGDIPILINDDSADVWAERANFHLELRAGAPPDASSPGGQNWGFPTYNWNHLRSTGFSWWKKRLKQAAKFYHAYRIDHVLGFFRIWAVPEKDLSAMSGFYEPSVPVSREELENRGYDRGFITWLSNPHIPGEELRDKFGGESSAVEKMLEQVGSEDLWRGGPESPSEKEITDSSLSLEAKERLIGFMRNKTLLKVGSDTWVPSINFRDSRGWITQSDTVKDDLSKLFKEKASLSEALWESTGRELLSMMKMDGSMLVCAEDLGAIPPSVPGVLASLGILGLKVLRWSRKWDEPGQPYMSFSDYPELSVATSSVHDSTTLRGWLSEEAKNDHELRQLLGLDDESEMSLSELLETVLEKLQDSPSLIAAYPIQDLLALDPYSVTEDPEAERINVPGTVQESNWTWRMGISLENLMLRGALTDKLKSLCLRREGRDVIFIGDDS